jgi:peptidoglycan/xylan/chitin deacetylase (PgdA/CDA1 family)
VRSHSIHESRLSTLFTPMRLDRAVSLHLIRPLAQRLKYRSGGIRIPILMYHSISDEVQARHPYYEMNTSPQVFRRQMSFLCQNGYSTVSLGEAVNALETHGPDLKSVVITFDDGYKDFYTDAFPILHECGFSAALFLATGRVGNKSIQFEGKEYITWSEVRELQPRGIRIGSHTISHPTLVNLKEPDIDRELCHSKRTIEDELGVGVTSFSYPYAFPETDRPFVKRLKTILEMHGYENGVSTILGTARRDSNPFFLPRIPINTWDDLQLFRAKLEGAYDWLHCPQQIVKVVKGRFRSERAVESVAVN